MLTLGIDDAGRGPIIGPMILAGVLIDENSEAILKKNPVKDSKILSHPQRIALGKLIREASLGFHIVKSYPEDIDKSLKDKINLNTLEAIKTAEIINELNDTKKIKVIVDCPSVNTEAWRKTLLKYIKHPENLTVICEHKADANYIAVSAASILAKVAREDEVDLLKKKYGEEIGSGYPSDPYTKEFLKKSGKKFENDGIFRKSWATWKALFPEKEQKNLKDF